MTVQQGKTNRVTANRYLSEVIDYGGILCTRPEAILDMQSMGLTQVDIDRWLQGYELGCRLREKYGQPEP